MEKETEREGGREREIVQESLFISADVTQNRR